MKFNLSIFPLMDYAFGVKSLRTLCLALDPKTFVLYFFLKILELYTLYLSLLSI